MHTLQDVCSLLPLVVIWGALVGEVPGQFACEGIDVRALHIVDFVSAFAVRSTLEGRAYWRSFEC